MPSFLSMYIGKMCRQTFMDLIQKCTFFCIYMLHLLHSTAFLMLCTIRMQYKEGICKIRDGESCMSHIDAASFGLQLLEGPRAIWPRFLSAIGVDK